MSFDLGTSSSTTRDIVSARQAERVAFLHRAPFVLDGLALGFLPGFREDCGYQADQYLNLDIPVGILDNDFRNPDLDRFVDQFFEHEPQVGVIGDVYRRNRPRVKAVERLNKPRLVQLVQSETHKNGLKTLIQR